MPTADDFSGSGTTPTAADLEAWEQLANGAKWPSLQAILLTLIGEVRRLRCVLVEAEQREQALTQKIEALRGEIHHNVSPVIGLLRAHASDGSSYELTPDRAEKLAERLYRAMDASDAALGERPLREQIDTMKAQLKHHLNAFWHTQAGLTGYVCSCGKHGGDGSGEGTAIADFTRHQWEESRSLSMDGLHKGSSDV